jgi:3-hydroxyisobutyrate dehydrogenase
MIDTIQIDGIHYDLTALEKDCWVRLLNGSLSYKNPFHNPVVANSSSKGVNLRTIVLRKVDTQKKELFFHTDIRSGKWNELLEDDKISWHFYNPAGKLQLRLSGTITLHNDDAIANEGWRNSKMSSRKVYTGEFGPSTIVTLPTSGLPEEFDTTDPTPEESEVGRKNFGVISTKINWMEWLWLNSNGHRRASFEYSSPEYFEANWLIP